ncbi:MAG: RHS repeat-associated core domain-containing protein, partial [Bryobacteraceae bacterium]
DSLNRLSKAESVGPQWGQAFTYDGFGNRLNTTVTKGSAPASSLTVDGNTNRLVGGYSYDANGNMTNSPSLGSMTYDVENRLLTVGGDSYGYAPDNKRVWKARPAGTEEIYFYGVGGQKLLTLGIQSYLAWQSLSSTDVWFGGRKIVAQGQAISPDRLGSARNGPPAFPYGEERTVTTNDKDKFGTYYRDGTTGLDYADQRYYSTSVGRFLTADPYQASGGASNPGSWNRYKYAGDDPVNLYDPEGLWERNPCTVDPNQPACVPGYWGPGPGGGSGGPPTPSTFDELEFTAQGGWPVAARERPYDAMTTSIRKVQLSNRLNSLGNDCVRAFADAGYTVSSLKASADAISYYDGQPQSQYSNYTENAIVGNNSARPVGDHPLVISLERSWGLTQKLSFFYANFYGATDWQQQNTLLHELFHVLGYPHEEIVAKFSSSGLANESDISAWLERDCKKR